MKTMWAPLNTLQMLKGILSLFKDILSTAGLPDAWDVRQYAE